MAAIGYLESVILDCPDPRELARFYANLFDGEVVQYDEDRAELVLPQGDRPLIAFQRVKRHKEPVWNDQEVGRQLHLDIKVDDLDAGEAAVLALGARLTGRGGQTYRIYLDPAGHPFCLINPVD